MPDTKNGTPEDYAEYKRQMALEVPVRNVQDSDETPEQRTQRYLNRQSENETPDQRTARYLEKARRAGYMTQGPMAPTGSDITSSLDKLRGEDFAEQDNNIRQGIHDTLHPAPAMALADKVGAYGKEHISEGWRDRLRSLAEGYVARVNPVAHQAGQDRQIEENARAIEIAKRYAQPRDEGEIDEPAPGPMRQPAMMEREFSSDQEKELYLQKVRQAMANAKK